MGGNDSPSADRHAKERRLIQVPSDDLPEQIIGASDIAGELDRMSGPSVERKPV
jgi:hypothetical protein